VDAPRDASGFFEEHWHVVGCCHLSGLYGGITKESTPVAVLISIFAWSAPPMIGYLPATRVPERSAAGMEKIGVELIVRAAARIERLAKILYGSMASRR
jgi:hypothetical protein